MKRILFLSFYFRPDLCAGSFRNSPLLDELAKQSLERNVRIDVYTTTPNRYPTYSNKYDLVEESGNVRIERIKVPTHSNGLIDQIISFKTFYFSVLKKTKKIRYDLVYASSSRLFTANLGAKISRNNDIPLYLDIRDIFFETIQEVTNNKLLNLILYLPLKYVEFSTFNQATHINLISGGFSTYFEKFQKSDRSYFTHGIDSIFFDNEFNKISDSKPNKGKHIILYAGNIGEGQVLEKIIPEAALKLSNRYQFRIIGDGGAMNKLESEVKRFKLQNVDILNPVNRIDLVNEYKQADALLIHLNNLKAFESVLPSKIFEIGATGKTVIAGIEGYSKQFLSEYLPDAIFFKPCDPDDLVKKLSQIRLSEIKPDRKQFLSKFKREQVDKEFAKSILSYL